jgi:membrane-bound serine protease (ClpP class)
MLALDTPGGSLDAIFDIIDSIQQSPVPVIGYVYPQGRSAWSAGTIILRATDYAAMAPFVGLMAPVTYKVWKAKKRKAKQFVTQSEEGVPLD